MNENITVMQVLNLLPEHNFENPQPGRVYSIEGIAPTIMNTDGGGMQPKIIIYDE